MNTIMREINDKIIDVVSEFIITHICEKYHLNSERDKIISEWITVWNEGKCYERIDDENRHENRHVVGEQVRDKLIAAWTDGTFYEQISQRATSDNGALVNNVNLLSSPLLSPSRKFVESPQKKSPQTSSTTTFTTIATLNANCKRAIKKSDCDIKIEDCKTAQDYERFTLNEINARLKALGKGQCNRKASSIQRLLDMNMVSSDDNDEVVKSNKKNCSKSKSGVKRKSEINAQENERDVKRSRKNVDNVVDVADICVEHNGDVDDVDDDDKPMIERQLKKSECDITDDEELKMLLDQCRELNIETRSTNKKKLRKKISKALSRVTNSNATDQHRDEYARDDVIDNVVGVVDNADNACKESEKGNEMCENEVANENVDELANEVSNENVDEIVDEIVCSKKRITIRDHLAGKDVVFICDEFDVIIGFEDEFNLERKISDSPWYQNLIRKTNTYKYKILD